MRADTEMQIRPAAPFEASVLAALHAACFGTADAPSQKRAWDSTAMAQFIAGPATVCLLATAGTEDPRPVGSLIARGAQDEAELLTIGVLSPMRRSGVGRALLERAAADLSAAGVQALYLEVDETNGPALALYQAFGARSVGRRAGYYEGGGNAAVLRLDLPACPVRA